MERTQPHLVMTDRDYERLSSLIEGIETENVNLLWDELARAELVPQQQVSSDVVTMNSTVRVIDLESEIEKEVKIVYPSQSEISEGKISVLAPVGTALLGLKVGQTIEWPLPSGRKKKMKVLSVKFQPEFEGIFGL